MPDTIDFNFREAIAARKKMTKFFREAGAPLTIDPETANHEQLTTFTSWRMPYLATA